MRRYWFEFDDDAPDLPPGVGYGVGVTALSYEDALQVMQRAIVETVELKPRRVIEDIDIWKLDPLHVLPNMADPARAGVWFPLGYS